MIRNQPLTMAFFQPDQVDDWNEEHWHDAFRRFQAVGMSTAVIQYAWKVNKDGSENLFFEIIEGCLRAAPRDLSFRIGLFNDVCLEGSEFLQSPKLAVSLKESLEKTTVTLSRLAKIINSLGVWGQISGWYNPLEVANYSVMAAGTSVHQALKGHMTEVRERARWVRRLPVSCSPYFAMRGLDLLGIDDYAIALQQLFTPAAGKKAADIVALQDSVGKNHLNDPKIGIVAAEAFVAAISAAMPTGVEFEHNHEAFWNAESLQKLQTPATFARFRQQLALQPKTASRMTFSFVPSFLRMESTGLVETDLYRDYKAFLDSGMPE